ncbi:MAG TPA: Sec-independent protein translocase protein TatB [Acidimicrobiales bacterium]|jgi:sec-independent protein translocase protein TatB
MFNVGGGELLVIMLLALIVLGPQKLPGAVRQAGRVMGEVRRISSGFQQELKDAFDHEDDVVDLPTRRRESVPLASTVAETEADHAGTSSEAGGDEPEAEIHDETDDRQDDAADGPVPTPTLTTPELDDDETVAPAMAAALDEIVTPLAPAPEPTEADAADGTGDAGDHRAAS